MTKEAEENNYKMTTADRLRAFWDSRKTVEDDVSRQVDLEGFIPGLKEMKPN